MTYKDIKFHRLCNQQIAVHNFKTAAEVVRWLGAVQAQDYLGSLWAIGQRLNKATEGEIENAIANRKIVRTWPMRGTLHFVAPEDIRWMLKLLTPRIIARSARPYKQAGLDSKIFAKCRKIFIRALEGGKCLTRDEMYNLLDIAKIDSGDLRGLHIIGQLAQEGLLCLGARKGKQQTFTLLDEWVPAGKLLKRDEALAELASRYFKSHAPATVSDFAWWSGLTKAEAKEGFEIVKSQFICQDINHQEYIFYPQTKSKKEFAKAAHLLPAYDEFLVSYKDRSAAFDPAIQKADQNLIFKSIIVMNGVVHGTWRRTLKNKDVCLELMTGAKLTKAEQNLILAAVERYGRFLGKPVKLV